MNRNVHLKVGHRVVNMRTGRFGNVVEPHYLARPARHEICIHYDGEPPETGVNVDREEIEPEGSSGFAQAMKQQPSQKSA